MFAQGFLDSIWSDSVLFFVRVIATIGGAVVGWFVCDPVTRGLYRLSFKGATPGAVLFGAKASGAAGLAVLMWIIVPTLFGGGGGFGFGAGAGGGPGQGKDKGGDKKIVSNGNTKDGKDSKDGKNNTPKTDPKREPLKIEILGGPRFKNDGEERFYLLKLKDADSTRSLAEVEEYVKQHPPRLIEIIHTDDTAVFNTDEDPTRRLQKLASKYEIPTQGPKE